MFSQTRRSLEDFDNQHDFERMAADILNALGYSDVQPIAPRGGADGGRDIRFREGETLGIAFVTLDKNIKEKFKRDLSKQDDAGGVIALFCSAEITTSTKLAFAKDAIAKDYRLHVFDLERLRSLLDSSCREIRRRYLHLDDEVAAKLRSDVRKLLKFPDAVPDDSRPPTQIEQRLVDKLPRRLFDLLVRHEESDIAEVPAIGNTLMKHLIAYYGFRQNVLRFENELHSRIAEIIGDRFNSQAVWGMYFQYAVPRFLGAEKEEIVKWGNFLNYGLTWDDTEEVFSKLSNEPALMSQAAHLLGSFDTIRQSLNALAIDGGLA